MIVVNECVIARKVVSKVENELCIDSDANCAGDGCEDECGVQEDFVAPLDSSLRKEQGC